MEAEGEWERRGAKNRVRVGIRVRPMIARELLSHERSCVEYPSRCEVVIGGERQYKFDRVFGEAATQEEVYAETARELIMGCFEGYNAAILAYGQTGSGKTFTMGTNTTTMDCNEQGIIPKVIHDLFDEIDRRRATAEFNVKVSFLEIYNEQIIDLLDGHKALKVKDSAISIREEKDGSVSIHGAVEEQVAEAGETLALLDQGSINRTTAATMMNDSSSRSHAIFSITLEQHRLDRPPDQDDGYITAKFFFVDLAGSERAKKTGATGATLKEGISINLGLLELGNVISALAADKKEAFITYRNSKLTRILQDSLGGNSNTYMIACISPAESNYEESLNTLKYASKAMNIKNKPVVNRDPHSALLSSLRERIKLLENDNQRLRDLLSGQGIAYSLPPLPPAFPSSPATEAEHELKALSGKYAVLQRRNEKLQQQLKEQKKRKNQLQIQAYEMQRERDVVSALLEQIRSAHPDLPFHLDQNTLPLIENYLTKIQQLQTDILDREKVNNQLQIEYARIRDTAERDEQILLKKNETIYNLARDNKQLKANIHQLRRELARLTGEGEEEREEEEEGVMATIEEALEEEESLEADEEFKVEAKEFSANEASLKTELQKVEHVISEKESILSKIAGEQMELEYRLIEEMKEEYHQKISELEREKAALGRQPRENAARHAQKLEVLEQELREFRNKAKEQRQLQQRLSQQTQTIRALGSDIKTFKMQKLQLHRLLKQDQDSFQKYRHKRTQELMHAKRENLKKDVQIRKLTNENKKKNWSVLKKNDELKRIRKLNDTLKQLARPTHAPPSPAPQGELDGLIERCLKSILIKIDREFDIAKYSAKWEEIEKELEGLVRTQSALALSLERLQLQDQAELTLQEQAQRERAESEQRLSLHDLTERINNLEDSRQFCAKKYEELMADAEHRYTFNAEAEILYHPAYNSLPAMRDVCRALLAALERLLIENYNIKIAQEEVSIKNTTLQAEMDELRESMVKMTLEHQQNVSRLREELMLRIYEPAEEEEQGEAECQQGQREERVAEGQRGQQGRLCDREKKNYERKIIELTRNNSKLSNDLEVWRRKCNIIQDKYQSMRSLFDKDKFIGRPLRDDENNINSTNSATAHRKHTPPPPPSPTPLARQSLLEELSSMAERLKSSFRGGKKSLNLIEECAGEEDKEVGEERNACLPPKWKWECVATIDAHTSPILAVRNYKHLLVSAATRSIRLWDLETNQMSSDITGLNLNSFVKALAVAPEKELLAAACDRVVTLWDLRTSNSEGVLRGHKDEVRALRIVNNYLFSAGKGLSNSGGLLVWDLRYLNFNSPMEEKERSQDIFSLTSHNSILYYGTRDHHVRRLNLETMETLTTFQPPHMDTVTGLAISRGCLISGSKDKNLRLWSLDNSIYNLKSTLHASNDYITTVEADRYHPVFYSADRTGQVKVATVLKERIDFLGVLSHPQSVNAVCSLDALRGTTATACADKTIKLWQPANETFHQLQNAL